ncbi:MAG: DMT family transporter [Bdellovibrionales bacterium]|nr:DMT family transporter [Bdellovibrionales bacterium]
MGLGGWLSLGCALAWALAVVLFKRAGESVSPFSLNLFKNTLAFLLMIPTLAVVGPWPPEIPEWRDLGILFVSGFIGIAVADTLFFRGLRFVGASLTAVVECLYSPCVILLSIAFLGERLTGTQALGSALVLGGVLGASLEGRSKKAVRSRETTRGVILIGAAVALMAVGIVLAKPVVEHLPLVVSVQARLFAGTAGLWLMIPVLGIKATKPFDVLKTKDLGVVVLASFVGTYVSMLLWIGGIQRTEASLAAVLNQTSTVFTLALAALLLRERISLHRILSAGVAAGGVLVIALA